MNCKTLNSKYSEEANILNIYLYSFCVLYIISKKKSGFPKGSPFGRFRGSGTSTQPRKLPTETREEPFPTSIPNT